jgi:hypothetical protein
LQFCKIFKICNDFKYGIFYEWLLWMICELCMPVFIDFLDA